MIPCIVCGTKLEPAIPDANDHQPSEGLIFISHGNYGSTVFDSITREQFLQVIICDSCTVKAAAQGNVLEVEHRVDHQWDYKDWVPFQEDDQ